MRKRGGVAVAGAGLLVLGAWLLWSRGPAGPIGGSGSEAPGGEERAGRSGVEGRPDRRDVRAAELGAIAGTIRDLTGAPIAGAHVCGNASSEELATDDIRAPICATTGADGRYRLARLLPASYRIDASAPRFRPAQHRDRARGRDELLLAPGEERGGVDLVLQPGGIEVVGTVKDIGGGPISGAWVQASSRRAGAASLTRTADDGTFRLWFVPGPLRLVALADGYVEGDITTIAPGRTIEILLTPESILAGRVVEAGSGRPVPGARVGFDGRNSAVSDEEGRFRLTNLLPGRYKPFATSPTGVGKASDSVLVGLGQTVEGVTIELHPAAEVTGRVTVAGTGAPCEGRLILDLPAAGRSRQAPIVGGQTRMDGVLPGTYQVSVQCRGCLPFALQPELVVDLAAPPGEQRWTAQPGARIRGVVRDADGTPVAAAAVMATHAAKGSGASGRNGSARSQPDGTFEIDQLVGGPYSVVAEAPDRPPAGPIEVTVSEAGEAAVEIRLPRGGELVGEVVDDGGRPVPGASIAARDGGAPEWVGAVQTWTRDDGTFALHGLAPGRYDVHVAREDTPPGMVADGVAPGATATVSVGETARARIVVPAHHGIIRGRVVDGEGAPITDAFVTARTGEGAREAVFGRSQRRPALTDTAGAFAIERLAPGLHMVRAYRRGGGEALAEGVAIGADVTLVIQPTGSIAGEVRTDRGVVPERITVTARDRDTGLERRESSFRTGGRFAIKDLPPGRFDVRVRAAEGTAATEVRIEAGQAVTGLSLVLAGAPPQD